MRTRFSSFALAASIALALVFMSCSSDDGGGESSNSSDIGISSSISNASSSFGASTGSSSSSTIGVMPPLRAQPIAASKNGEPKVLESWTEGNKNWYIIDVGYIDNSLVMETDHERYEGLVEITFSKETTVKTSISENRTTSVSNSIVVSNSTTETIGIEAAIKAAVKANAFGVEGSIESSLKSNQQISQTVGVSQGRTTSTSETLVESFEKSVKDVLTMKLDKNVPIGYYRYAWYTTWDVYFVVSTSLDNQKLLSWDVVSCPRAVGTKGLEYSPDNKFDNSPISGSEIVFAEDFYKTLPKPLIEKTQEKIDTITFDIAGNHSYPFDKGFPATIEIYALGAGGGGQGGHWWILNSEGTGGSGGGGGAVYTKLNVEEPVTFNITIGKGGEGGGGRRNDNILYWEPGNSGKNGENTSVTWIDKNITITANGGGGGYHNGGKGSGNAKGGTGGNTSSKPASSLVTDWFSANGKSGVNGVDWTCIESNGGTAGSIVYKESYYDSFGGGSGGRIICNSNSRDSFSGTNGGGGSGGYGDYNNNLGKGGNGGDGQVKIVVKYILSSNKENIQ